MRAMDAKVKKGERAALMSDFLGIKASSGVPSGANAIMNVDSGQLVL